MNWLTKLNWINLRKYLGAFNALLVLLCLIGGSLYAGYRIGNYYSQYQQSSLTNQQNRLESLYGQQEEQLKRINTLSVELELEKMANYKARNEISKLEESNFQLKKELAFYQMVMAPEKSADGLIIENVEIYPTESDRHYRYRVILVQQQKNKRYVKGSVDLTISGSLNAKPAAYSLQKLNGDENDLAFNFQYFQIIEGEVTVPENFIPELVQVTAKLPKTQWQKASELSQAFAWPKKDGQSTQVAATILD